MTLNKIPRWYYCVRSNFNKYLFYLTIFFTHHVKLSKIFGWLWKYILKNITIAAIKWNSTVQHLFLINTGFLTIFLYKLYCSITNKLMVQLKIRGFSIHWGPQILESVRWYLLLPIKIQKVGDSFQNHSYRQIISK